MEEGYRGQYVRECFIGKGAFGVVYKVRSVRTREILIAKHVNIKNLPRDKPIKQFQILKQLSHPYIVRFIESISSDDELILIMQYCGERDLAYHIEKMRDARRRFSEKLITNWLLQMLLATQHMHSKKILHRDLKPQNIFLDSDLNLKVGDFGISKVLCSTHQNARTFMGTPCYTAPQMYSTEAYSNKTDIWSLGCIVFEICSLRRLFSATDAKNKPIGIFQVLENVQNAPIADIPNDYSKELKEIVQMMLRRNPAQRPSTAQLLQHPSLLQLMVNSTTKTTLKQEYANNLHSSHSLQHYKGMLQERLKQLEEDIHVKMDALKRKKLTKTQFNAYYRQVQEKTKEIQDTVKTIFLEMQGNSVDSNQSNASNESDITLQSVDVSNLHTRHHQLLSADVNQQSEETVLSTFNETLNNTLGKINQAQLTLKNISAIKNVQCSEESKQYESIKKKEGSESAFIKNPIPNIMLGQTLRSQYFSSTMKSDTLNYTLGNTMNVPRGNTTLNGTLKQSLLTNTMKSQIKNEEQFRESMQLSESLASEKANNMNILRGIITKKAQPVEEEEYLDDFEPYEETEEDATDREEEMGRIVTLYREMLKEMEQPPTKDRGKYLVMSQIKEQSGEGGSVISSNASRETFSPLLPGKSNFSKGKLTSTK